MLKSTNNTATNNTTTNSSKKKIANTKQPILIEEAITKIRSLGENENFKIHGIADDTDIQSIKESLDKIKKNGATYKNKDIINLMWNLSKIRYYEEDLFLRYRNNILNGMNSIKKLPFVQLLQSMAILTLFDADILNACLRRLPELEFIDNTEEFIDNTQGISCSAYFISVILINSVQGNGYEALETNMKEAVNNLVNTLLNTTLCREGAKQILDIHNTGIIKLSQKRQKTCKKILTTKKKLTTSQSQLEVSNCIQRSYIGAKVTNEFYDEAMCAYRDIRLDIPNINIRLDIEFDGNYHYFINRLEKQNGTTLFRNHIYRIVHNDDLVIISRTIDNKDSLATLTLYTLNQRIASITERRERKELVLANLKKEEPMEPVHSPNSSEEATETNTAITTQNSDSKKKRKKKKNKTLDSLLESYIAENIETSNIPHVFNESDYNNMLNKYKANNLSKLLEKLLENIYRDSEFKDFKLVADYKKSSIAFQNKAGDLLNKEIKCIEDNLENANPETLEKINCLIEYADINIQAKCLAFSITYGFSDLFAKILDINLPNKENANVFIDLLFFANLCNNRLDIAKLLFEKYPINIDSHYKFIYAFSVTSMFSDLRLNLSDIATSFISEYFKNKKDDALYILLNKNQVDCKNTSDLEKEGNILATYLASNAPINNEVIHWLIDKGATYNIAEKLSVDGKIISESFHCPDDETITIIRRILLRLHRLYKTNNCITMKEQVFDFIPKEIEASDGATGLSPLHILAMTNDTDFIPYLNIVGFDVNQELKKADGINSTHLVVKAKGKKEDKEYRIPYGATPASLVLKNDIMTFSTLLDIGAQLDFTAFNSHLGCSILEHCENEKPLLYSKIMLNKALEITTQLKKSMMMMTMPDINPSCNPENKLTQTTLSTDLTGNIPDIIDYNHIDYTPAQSHYDRKIDGFSLKR